MNKGTNLFDVAMLFHDFCISANSVVPNRLVSNVLRRVFRKGWFHQTPGL